MCLYMHQLWREMEGSNKINMQDPFHIWSFSLYLWVTTLFEFHCFPQQINGSLLSKLSPSGLYDLLSCRSLTRNSYMHGKNERHKIGSSMTCIGLIFVVLFDTRKHFMHFLLDMCVFRARTRALWVHGPVALCIQGTLTCILTSHSLKMNGKWILSKGISLKFLVQFSLFLRCLKNKTWASQVSKVRNNDLYCSYFRVTFWYAKIFHAFSVTHLRFLSEFLLRIIAPESDS